MKMVLNVRCKKFTKGITFIHLEEILQLFVNMNVLKLANLKLFAKSINLKFWKDFVGIKCVVIKKKIVISRVLFFTVGLKLENYLQKFTFNKTNSSFFLDWLQEFSIEN